MIIFLLLQFYSYSIYALTCISGRIHYTVAPAMWAAADDKGNGSHLLAVNYLSG